MKSLTKLVLFVAAIFVFFLACTRDEIDLDKMSKMVRVERDIALPISYGQMYLKDMIGENTDSILTIEGDTTFTDTIGFSIGNLDNLEIDFCNLHYVSKNHLPIGFGLNLVTFDSVSNSILDTIRFSTTGLFLEPATLDSDGNVIESLVNSKEDIIEINGTVANNLLKRATHIIMFASLYSDTTRIIPVTEKNYVWLDLGIEASGAYTTKINQKNEDQ